MFFHNINPVFFSIGPASIRYYGLVYFIGFLFFYFYLRYQVRKNRIKNMDYDSLDTFMIYFIIGGILGARLFEFLFYIPGTLLANPLEFFMIWHGGMSIHGGIVGGMIAAYMFTKKNKISFYKLADLAAIPLLFFLAIGRLANFINGELWGTISSNTATCIDYTKSQFITNPPTGCRYPYQIYASLKNLVVGVGLIFIKNYSKLKEGLLFWWALFLYNILRFLVDFVREEPRLLGITMGQTLSFVFAAVSIYFIIKMNKDKK